MIIKDGDCEHCEHFVKDAYGQWVCEFDGECENMVRKMTNEEYLKSCDTEQLAEAIYYLTWFHTELDERLDKNVKNGCYNDDENIKIVMEWLKQPHKDTK